MKVVVSVRSSRYNEFVGYVGAAIETTFASEWDALEWLQQMYERGYKVSKNSNLTADDVQKHSLKTR